MKLLKKLLPIVTMGCVASIVAPLVTSCGEKGKTYAYNKSFEFTRKKAEGSMDNKEAAKFYFDAIKKQPKCLTDDLAIYTINYLKDYDYEGLQTPDLKKMDLNITVYEVDTDEQRLSIKYDLESTLVYEIDEGKKVNLDYSVHMNMKNYKWILQHHNYSMGWVEGWWLTPLSDAESLSILLNDNKWSLGLEINQIYSGMREQHDSLKVKVNSKSPSSDILFSTSCLLHRSSAIARPFSAPIEFSSIYLSEVEYTGE